MDKSFESLYKIAIAMADSCIINSTIENRFSKLEEEYQELIEAFNLFKKQYEEKPTNTCAINDKVNDLMDEVADVLFVIFHIAHKFNKTPFDLLHQASSKMLSRMNDVNYTSKK